MLFELERPSWAIEGRDWPNREHSRFISAGRLSWHVQELGEGPKLLLVHGTGAATHSFRDLGPMLAARFQVLAPDLPGHGFTQMPPREGLSLRGMARSTSDLLVKTGFDPLIVVGHSAGAAVLVEMVLDSLIRPKLIIAINGAIRPIRGAALFKPMAKVLFLNPLAPRLFARRATDREATRRLLEGTGSRIEPRGIDLYARLFRRSGHVAGTLGMMANWDLDRLARRIGALTVPLVLLTSTDDKAIPPRDADDIAASVASARSVSLGRGGHLVHEESPRRVADRIFQLVRDAGLELAA